LIVKFPLSTALAGTLQRGIDGWHWSDGTPEPRVRDMRLRDIAPNFRCARRGSVVYVEIPAGWRSARYWPAGRIDIQAAREIEGLLRDAGKQAPIFAEGLAEVLDDHRLTTDGWLVDIAQWDAVMSEACGVWWDSQYEANIHDRAAALGRAG
jgi:hypothetical protein